MDEEIPKRAFCVQIRHVNTDFVIGELDKYNLSV